MQPKSVCNEGEVSQVRQQLDVKGTCAHDENSHEVEAPDKLPLGGLRNTETVLVQIKFFTLFTPRRMDSYPPAMTVLGIDVTEYASPKDCGAKWSYRLTRL